MNHASSGTCILSKQGKFWWLSIYLKEKTGELCAEEGGSGSGNVASQI